MESTPEQAIEGLAIVRVLSAVLDRLVCANVATARADPGQVTKFHALKAPGIGIMQYLERIHKYASCSSECFIMALIYIDRLIQRNNFLLTELNVHRVVITAVLLAAKFFDDAYYNNAYYAKVGGVLVSEMNGLEVDFLFRINFSLHVTPDVFEKYRAELLSHSVSAAMSIQPIDLSQTAVMPNQQLANLCQITAPAPASAPAPVHIQNYPMHHETLATVPSQITPSPPRVTTGTSTTPSHLNHVNPVVAAAEMMVADEAMRNAFSSTDINFIQQNIDFNYLQRANSCPVPAKSPSTYQQICQQPQPFSAPPMIAMVPGGIHLQTCVESNDYVMVDNQIFQFPTQHNHNPTAVDVTELLHQNGVASGFTQRSHHPASAYMTRDPVSGLRFIHGRMLTGVSGGL